jgi:DnaJ family protein A protein 2
VSCAVVEVSIRPLLTFGHSYASGDIKVISGQGMPSHRHHDFGNLYVKTSIKFPDTLSPEQLQTLEKALPARRKLNKIPQKIFAEEVHLEEPSEREKAGAANADGMEEDDEDERGGGPGVQCAQREFILVVDASRIVLLIQAFRCNRINEHELP